MKHVIYTLLFATVAGALTFGAAASLTVNSSELGSGGTEVSSCDPDGVEVSYDLLDADPSMVNEIVVNGIATECAGQTLHYVVLDEAGEVVDAGSGLIAGPSQPFLVKELEVAQVNEIVITIAG